MGGCLCVGQWLAIDNGRAHTTHATNTTTTSTTTTQKSGTDAAYNLIANLYEPRLPPLPATPKGLAPEHLAWAEDQLAEMVAGHKFGVKQVGWLQK